MTIIGVALWIILIGFVAGVIARVLMPGPHSPKGFVVTTVLGVAGAILASAIGDAIGLYRPGQGAGLIGTTVGSLIILFLWNRLVASRIIPDHSLLELSIRRFYPAEKPAACDPTRQREVIFSEDFGCVPSALGPILNCSLEANQVDDPLRQRRFCELRDLGCELAALTFELLVPVRALQAT